MYYALRRFQLKARIHSQVGSSPAAVLREIQKATDRGRRAAAGLCTLLLSLSCLFFSLSAAPALSPVPPLLLCSHSPLKSPLAHAFSTLHLLPLSHKHTLACTSVSHSLYAPHYKHTSSALCNLDLQSFLWFYTFDEFFFSFRSDVYIHLNPALILIFNCTWCTT